MVSGVTTQILRRMDLNTNYPNLAKDDETRVKRKYEVTTIEKEAKRILKKYKHFKASVPNKDESFKVNRSMLEKGS